ncbi:hypothetical protein HTSR_1415 [Halodesulfurarchaeum formicicum]|uniref:Uncharacterized protein n=1 Tax=Halodesulfurarchaeum formicicum TaxID=1873524 RepID=A0A1D8S5G1_9EURY|nr:hypothetical protein [Halodesulfurarchaeum formicicum]AOW80591.1 hypothetical protein HTSR_1415 [Halodesulfurarchaeum formicicum]APE95930.1 hypothetical protein HSR6_1487 [Halodesulfurarchaeum formicicum]
MDELPAIRSPHSVPSYVGDGARIAAILLVWGAIAAFFAYGIGNVGLRGASLVGRIGSHLGVLFATVGLLNAVLFVCYRTIDYWAAQR